MRDRRTNNALHLANHVMGPYWLSAVVNTIKGHKGFTMMDTLRVGPNGDIDVRGMSKYMSTMGDLPPIVPVKCTSLVVVEG